MMGYVMISNTATPEILHISIIMKFYMRLSFINIDYSLHQSFGFQRCAGVVAVAA